VYSDRTRDRLQDIVDDGRRIALFLAGKTEREFAADERTLFAVERLLQRITEAVVQIGAEDMAKVIAELPVERMRGFGNRLRHEYRDLDQRLVFSIARNDLPPLTAAAARALET